MVEGAGQRGAKGTKRLSGLDAAAQILATAKQPLTAKEITDGIFNQHLWYSGGKTPAATIYAAMIRENATVFQAYVWQVLIRSLRPGDIVVMDNLSPHKSAGIAEAIEAAGAEVWFLPPYSLDFNPIEKMWSKMKAFLRAAKARTYEALLEAIAAALKKITASDAIGWFESSGYRYELS